MMTWLVLVGLGQPFQHLHPLLTSVLLLRPSTLLPNLFCLHPWNVSGCSIVWNWPSVLAAGSYVPSELFLMDTVFIKLISLPSAPCVDDKTPLCFSLCRRTETPFRCLPSSFLSSGRDGGYILQSSSKISSCYSVTDWMAEFFAPH